MPKFKFTIEETVVQDFTIEATNEAEARQKLHDGYYEGKIVVDNGSLEEVNYAMHDKNGECEEFDNL